MSAAVQFDVDPLIAALARLDTRVQQQAQALPERAAAQTAARVLAVYPRGETGNLSHPSLRLMRRNGRSLTPARGARMQKDAMVSGPIFSIDLTLQ